MGTSGNSGEGGGTEGGGGDEVRVEDQPVTPEPPPKSSPNFTIDEVFNIVAGKFGVTVDMMMFRHRGNTRSAVATPRNIAAFICIILGYKRSQIADYIGREYNAIRNIQARIVRYPKRISLAWGVWSSMGGEWEAFVAKCPKSIPQVELPKPEDYALGGISVKNERGEIVKVPEYFDPSIGLSLSLCKYFGLDAGVAREALVCQSLLKQGITDYLVGIDARKWIMEDMEESDKGITFHEACAILSIDEGWMRRKIKQIGDSIWEDLSHEMEKLSNK